MSAKSDLFLRFRCGSAKYAHLAMLLGQPEESDQFEPPTGLIALHTKKPPQQQWYGEYVDDVLIDICAYKHPEMDRPFFVTLSEEGAVWLQFPTDLHEQIPDAGLHREGAKGWGYASRIKQIGDDLLVAGLSGQFYRRTPNGEWSHIDSGLLDTGPNGHDLDVSDFDGGNDGDIWAVSMDGRIFHRSGAAWREVPNPAGVALYFVKVLPGGEVIAGGWQGTVIRQLESAPVTLHLPESFEAFTSADLYRGELYLSTYSDIYKLSDDAFLPVDLGLADPLRSAQNLHAVDDVLWSFGKDDVVRFDGEKWERFWCPQCKPFA